MKKTSLVGKLAASALLALPYLASAQGLAAGAPVFAGTSSSSLPVAVVNIINILLTVAGLVAALYLIYGGVTYITSQGDSSKAETAKSTIVYALAGLVVIGLSAAIVNFVLSAVVGS